MLAAPSTFRPLARRAAWAAPAVAILVLQLAVFPLPPGPWLQGAVLGLLNALVALGLALVYRANRVLNFAQADLGTLPAAIGVGLILLSGAHYLVGLAGGLAVAIILGVAVELVVVRRFAMASRLALTVAVLGVSQLLAALAVLVPRLWGESLLTGPRGSTYGVPWTFSVTVGDQVFRADDVVAAVVATACLVGVALVLRHSGLGVAIRASADRIDRAATLGVPTRRLQSIVWATAAALSFVGVFFQGAIVGFPLSGAMGLTSLVPALAAVALGGFVRLPTILTAAVAIGVLNKGVAWNNAANPAVVSAVLAGVVVVGLLVRRTGNRRSDAEATTWRRTGAPADDEPARRGRRSGVRFAPAGLVVVLAAAVALPAVLTAGQTYQAASAVAVAMVGLSVVVLTGWAGQVSLGQMAFAGVGGAVGALATAEWQLDLTGALLVGGLAGAAAATVVGLPALRVDGIFLAVTTVAFSLATAGYLLNPTQATWIPTGTVARRPLLGTWDLTGHAAMYHVTLAVLVLSLAALWGIRRSRSGRVLRALRDNPRAVQAYGVSAARAKLTSFAVSGFLAGVGGCLLTAVNQGYDVATYAPLEGLNVFATTVVGGAGAPAGAIVGALFLNATRWLLPHELQLVPGAIMVLLVLWLVPGGLVEATERLRVAVRSRLAPQPPEPRRRRTPGGADAPAPTAGSDRATGERPVLRVEALDVAYGAVPVLFGVDLEVRPGEILAVLGTNGAGKSTLVRAITGVAPVTRGRIALDGDDLVGLRPEAVAGRGVVAMPGGDAVFGSLTVDENLRMASWLVAGGADVRRARAEEVYERFPVLASRREDPAADLSGGQQQMLGLGMALVTRPRLLLIDELSLGLAPAIVDDLLAVVREIRDAGTAVVVVEQTVATALELADRAVFMEKGEVRFAGGAADLLRREDLLRAVYLHGTAAVTGPARPASGAPDHASAARRPAASTGDDGTPALVVHDLTVAFGGIHAVDGVNLHVRRGEIVGVIGPNGAGKTTLFDLISGFTAADRGRVVLEGHDLSSRSAPVRARAGLGRSFQDSRLFPDLTVGEVLAVALERWIPVGDVVSATLRLPALVDTEAAVEGRVTHLLEALGLRPYRDTPVGDLSTGVRGIVDLACVVAHQPSVVLLDEPTAGIAQRETEALAPVLRSLRDDLGASLLIIEHDISLLRTVADRLIALDLGRVVTSGPPDEVLAHPQVIEAYLGTGAGRGRRRPQISSPAAAAPATLGHREPA